MLVISAIYVTLRYPARPLIAASLPGPGPFIKTSTEVRPNVSFANLASDLDATCAAYGVLFLEPLKPSLPAVFQIKIFPVISDMYISVLLYDACIYTLPTDIVRFIFFFVFFFIVYHYFFFDFLFFFCICSSSLPSYR